MKKKTGILASLVLAVFAITLCDLGLAQMAKLAFPWWSGKNQERTYRIQSEIYHHDLAKNKSVRAVWGSINYEYHTNNLGFRDKAVREIPKESDAWRLVFIGDSFTEGLGVAYEKTFVGRVEQRLEGKCIDVLNAAVSSYAPSIYYRKMKYLIETTGLDIDEVVTFIDISDVHDEALKYRLDENDRVADQGFSRVAQTGTMGPGAPSGLQHLKQWLLENSLLVRFADIVKDQLSLRGDFTERRLRLNGWESAWEYDDSAYENHGQLGLSLARANMDRLHDLLNRHRIKLRIVIYPWADQIFRNRIDSRQVVAWSAWAEERQIPILNLFPAFMAGNDARQTIANYFIPYDNHWSEAGHKYIADLFLHDYVGADPEAKGASHCQ